MNGPDWTLRERAKIAAKEATKEGREAEDKVYKAKSTVLGLALAKIRSKGRHIPEGVGKWTKAMDMAFPGKHTRRLYDGLEKKDASLLAQLRTNKTKLRGYLGIIGAAETEICACGRGVEGVRHFLFTCRRWASLRPTWLATMGRMSRGSLGKALGGMTAEETEPWAPNTRLVEATLKFVRSTGRWEEEETTNY